MTPLPKRRISRARQGKRRASIKLVKQALISCPNCKKPIFAHMVCKFCGYYKSKEIVIQKIKAEKKKAEVAK